jgi:hypothetical protein
MDRENLAYSDLCSRERFRRLNTAVFNMNMPNCEMQAFHLVFHTSFLYLKLRRFHVMLEKGKV